MQISRQFHDITQNSEDWDLLRLGKFTASSFNDLFMKPELLGYSKAISKVAYERITGQSYGFYSNARMEAGHDLENLAREHYENLTFTSVLSGGFYFLNDWVGASPDGRVDGLNGGVEFKSRDPHVYFDYLKYGKLPEVNKWQVIGQLYVAGFDWIDYMPFCHPNLKTLIIRVYPDEVLFKQLEESLEVAISKAEEIINKIKC